MTNVEVKLMKSNKPKTIVRGVVVSANQFREYNEPVYEVQPGERILSAELKRESGNQLTLYIAVEWTG